MVNDLRMGASPSQMLPKLRLDGEAVTCIVSAGADSEGEEAVPRDAATAAVVPVVVAGADALRGALAEVEEAAAAVAAGAVAPVPAAPAKPCVMSKLTVAAEATLNKNGDIRTMV
ncbi:MAG TPA: hypothetical protein VGJ84_00360 [Polyangiaceae bacterium]